MEKIQYHFHTEMFRQTSQLVTARARLRATRPGKPLRILSFGSSIGEEVATLRFLFPNDEIYGCEIDDRVLEICQRSVGSLATIFKSSSEAIAANGPYDLILASAVLCLNPAPEDFKDRFPVSKFDDLVAMLDANLNPGGIFIVTNASYRFTESPVARGYDTIRSDIVHSAGFINVFTRKSRPYLQPVASSGGSIYKRRGNFVPRDDEDLADSVFEKRAGAGAAAVHELELAAPPASLIVLSQHKRLNTDWANKNIPERTVVVEYAYKFCRVEGTEDHGYVQEIGWTSLVGEGFHRRKPTWNPVP
ncbi:MAG: hypothetical protein JWM58_3172 [Rhizobium sp.]|nr:hypothetical protein [Rhizobium sp.]